MCVRACVRVCVCVCVYLGLGCPTRRRSIVVFHLDPFLVYDTVLTLSSCITEVKFQPQHTEGVEHSNVEPITPVSRALGLCDE